MLPYLVLLRTGFTMPRRVTTRAVRSYRTFSPLPAKLAVYFLWHFPWARTLQALPGVLPDGARTFLRIRLNPAITWPTLTCSSARLRGRASGPRIILHLTAVTQVFPAFSASIFW